MFEKAQTEEQANLLTTLAAQMRQNAGLELDEKHTTKLPTVWLFRLLYLLLGVISTSGVIFLNLRYLPREEARQQYVTREVFTELVTNTKNTAGAVDGINNSLLVMRGTLAELAAKAQKDQVQDERIERNEKKIDEIMERLSHGPK